MTKKRQSGSSVISVMEDESLDLENINEETVIGERHDDINYSPIFVFFSLFYL